MASKEFDVTIRMVVTKTYRVEAEDHAVAVNKASALSSPGDDNGVEDGYFDEILSCEEVVKKTTVSVSLNQPSITDWADSVSVFTVHEVEPGCWQSVFPSRLSGLSQLHEDPADAWRYIAEAIFDDLYSRLDKS